MDYKGILKQLVFQAAISGREEKMSFFLKDLFGNFCQEVHIDRFFNVTGVKRGSGKGRVLVTAHYDEIGFLVKSIDERGFIRLTSVGGLDNKILPAQEVIIHGKEEVYGVIGAKPPHLLDSEEKKKVIKLEEMYVDTGMTAEALKKLVSVGDAVTLRPKYRELLNGRISAKTVDNRCGVTALIATMQELSKLKHDCDVYFAVTTQEEFELAGAISAAYSIQPDLAIVIDACHGDVHDAPEDEVYLLGKGPAIGIGPQLDRIYTKKLFETAKENNIPYQTDVEVGDTGTEAWAVQVSRAGIPTTLISIPVRYMHTAIETVDMKDIINTAKLASIFSAGALF